MPLNQCRPCGVGIHLISFVFATITAQASIIFTEDFNSGAEGATPAGWTQIDILTSGDHASIGLRPDGSASGGGTGVFTRDGNDFF